MAKIYIYSGNDWEVVVADGKRIYNGHHKLTYHAMAVLRSLGHSLEVYHGEFISLAGMHDGWFRTWDRRMGFELPRPELDSSTV